MLQLTNITKVLQENYGGIKELEITDVRNPDFGSFLESGYQYMKLLFNRGTCKLSGKGSQGEGGYYSTLQISFTASKKRPDVELLISLLGNTKFAIRATDYNGVQTVLLPADITHTYDSGSQMTDANVYQFTISAVDIYKGGVAVLPPPSTTANPSPGTPTGIPLPDDGPSAEEIIFITYVPDGDTDPAPSGQFPTFGDPCDSVLLSPFQVDNDIDANITAPAGYTLTVTKGGVEVATALPYTITESGSYVVTITSGECTKSKSIAATYTDPATDFTIAITVAGQTLTAVTDATAPTYLWELETGTETTTISNAATAEVTALGLYRLSITENGVTKSTYHLHLTPDANDVNVLNLGDFNNPYRLVDSYFRVSGYQFDPVQIDLSKVNNPAIQLTVRRGTDVLNYVAGTPSEVDEYTINGLYQYEVWSAIPLNNEDFFSKLN